MRVGGASINLPLLSKPDRDVRLNIRIANEQDASDWDGYVLAHPQGTFFHRYGWKRLIETTHAHRGHYLLAEQGDRSDACELIEATRDRDDFDADLAAAGKILEDIGRIQILQPI